MIDWQTPEITLEPPDPRPDSPGGWLDRELHDEDPVDLDDPSTWPDVETVF